MLQSAKSISIVSPANGAHRYPSPGAGGSTSLPVTQPQGLMDHRTCICPEGILFPQRARWI
jgi:hypothetical protein